MEKARRSKRQTSAPGGGAGKQQVRRPPMMAADLGNTQAIDAMRAAAREGERPLAMPADVQARMEASFGMELGGVRLREQPGLTGLGVDAYAHGAEIGFAPGVFRPDTQSGLQALGHELSHVAAQARGEGPGLGGSLRVADSPSLEARADREGAMAARGEAIGPMSEGRMASVTPMSAGLSGGGGGVQLLGGKREHNRRLARQKAALDAEDAKYARWEAEGRAHVQDILENGVPKNAEQPEGEEVPIDIAALTAEAQASGWRDVNGNAFNTNITENFFREISGRAVEHTLDENGQNRQSMSTAFRSQQDIMDLFRNHDEATTLRVLRPLMELDVNAFTQQFPLDKMTPQERRAAFPQIDAILQPMVGLKQWAEKYGITTLSQANQDRLVEQIDKFENISKWAYNERVPSTYSFEQIREMQVDQWRDANQGRLHTAQMQRRMTQATDDLGAAGSTISYDEFDALVGDRIEGTKGEKVNSISERFPGASYNPATDMVTFPFQVDELRALAGGDRGVLDRYADELRAMSWRDENGNERRAGQYDSSVDEFMAGFDNDIRYFGRMRGMSELLAMFGGQEYLNSQRDRRDLVTRMVLSGNTFKMMSARTHDMSTPMIVRFENQYNRLRNKTWIKRSLLGKRRWV